MPRAYYPQRTPPVAKPVQQPVSGLNLNTMLTRQELSEKFHVSRATVYRAVKTGRLACVWFCGRQLFAPAEVERFVADNTSHMPRPLRRKEG